MPKKLILPDSFYETDFLKLYKNESSPHIRISYLGLSHIKDGETVVAVSKMLRTSYRTVQYWIQRFNKEGVEGLVDKSGRGAKRKLDKKHENKFCERVLKMQGSREGGRVRGEDVKEMLLREFEIKCSLSTTYDLLHRVGLSWISSRSKHPKQNPEAQELFKKLRRYRCRCHQCGSIL